MVDEARKRIKGLIEVIQLATGCPVEVHNPGEVTEDVNGIPSWVGPTETEENYATTPILTPEQWREIALYLIEERTKDRSGDA